MKKIDFKLTKEKALVAMDEIGKGVKVVTEKASDGKNFLVQQYDETKLQIDKKRLRPVFGTDLNSLEYHKPFIVRIVDYDKRMENEACIGAVGFEEKIKSEKILTLYNEFASKLGITFSPSVENTIYCADPYRANTYICLDDYFQYIKKAKVEELETVAHSLGAKQVKITFKEQKTRLVSSSKKSEIKITKENGAITQEKSNEEYSSLEVASEVQFGGNEMPSEPLVVYFKGENDIHSLIKMRLDPDNCNKIKSKTYRLSCINKREMQEETAANIDTYIKHIGITGNASVVSQIQAEKRTILEYYIEF